MTVFISDDVLGKLRGLKATALNNDEVRAVHGARDEVIARYSPSFQPNVVAKLSEETMRSFLYFENNKHWTGLNRQVNRICSDMEATRRVLADLVDETTPVAMRMDRVSAFKGMGKGIITAILHVTYPDRYGVWNNTSEAALIEFGLMPELPRGTSFGARYAAINEVLTTIAAKLDVDLWTLDALWWGIGWEDEPSDTGFDIIADDPPRNGAPTVKRSFALERHLHDYLLDNWSNLSLATEWDIYARPGEPEAGYEFSTPIGRIDLLARHRTEPRWLVIELKRQASSDEVVGQVLRYMGWIKAQLAEPGEKVDGLIVAHEGEERLHYAVSAVPNLSFMTYEVQFRLRPAPSLAEFTTR